MQKPDLVRALIVAFVTAILTHFGFYVSPPPTSQREKTPPTEREKPAPKSKPKPKPQPKPEEEPEEMPTGDASQAIGRIQFGSAGCTANIIGPRRKDGRYDILTAAHCIARVGQRGEMQLRSGKRFAVSVVVFDKGADCCWLVTDGNVGALPFLLLAERTPQIGSEVWHCGFGIDNPGNREDGILKANPNHEGQVEFELSVSPGDSGGAILDEATKRVISPVCCTSVLGARGRVWGASPEACRRIRPKTGATFEWSPVPMPQRMDIPDVLPMLAG